MTENALPLKYVSRDAGSAFLNALKQLDISAPVLESHNDWKICCWNVNGINNLYRKGFLRQFLTKFQPTIVFLSEIKIGIRKLWKLHALHTMLEALGYKYVRWHPERTGKGLHGTAILSRIIPNSLKVGYSSPDVHTTYDDGRVLSAVFPNFTILHTYSPCSSWPANADRTEQQQKAKDDARRQFDKDINEDIRFLQTHHKTPVVWCGDMNVIHLDRDVWHAQFAAADSPWAGAKSWERDNFRKIRRDRGLKDAYLETCLNPKRPEFTYWRPNLRKFNEGWRLDRVLCPQSMLSDGNHARIPIVHTLTDVQGSDHCPLLFQSRTHFPSMHNPRQL